MAMHDSDHLIKGYAGNYSLLELPKTIFFCSYLPTKLW